MADIRFEVGAIQLAEETTGFLGRGHECGEQGKFFLFFSYARVE
jgi:hypothetical protein